MAKYGGSWAKGFASTFNPAAGINLGLQWRQQKAGQKKIDDELEQLKISSTELAAKFDRARADGTITQQEFGDAMSWAIPLGKEISGRTQTLYANFKDMTPDQLQTELDNIDAILEFSKDLDFTNLEQMKAFRKNLTQPNAIMQWDLIIESIEKREKPTQAEIFPSAAAVTEAYPEAGYKYTDEGYVPEFIKPTAEKAPTAIEQKIAGINNLPIPDEQKLKMKIKVYGGGDTALEQKIGKAYEHGATDEEVKDMIVGRGIEIKITPETLGTLGSWEERFEGAKTEKAFEREQNLLEQSEDKYVPPYADWKERLVALTKERAEIMRGLLDEKGKLKNAEWKDDWEEMVKKYDKHIMELQTDYPDVDLSQFPKFNEWTALGLFSLIDDKGW